MSLSGASLSTLATVSASKGVEVSEGTADRPVLRIYL